MYNELTLTIICRQSIHHLLVQEHIGSWIHRAQFADPQFKEMHYDRGYKHFVFSNLYPLEKEGTYQRGRVYVITVRSSRKDTLQRIHACMQNCREDDYFELISSELRNRPIQHITEMITITPAIVTINRKPWVPESNVELLLQQLHTNAEKKYKDLNPEDNMEAFQPFIQGIRIENRKPVALGYKGHKLLGNKLRLFINEDAYSQKLANTVWGSGLAEKNSSMGAGFCLAKYLESS